MKVISKLNIQKDKGENYNALKKDCFVLTEKIICLYFLITKHFAFFKFKKPKLLE